MRLRWHHLALEDLQHLRAYIARDHPRAAATVAQRILEAVERLPEHPAMGRPGRVPDTRELVIAGTPYIVPYRVMGDTLVILRVLHGAMRWPEAFDA